MYVFQPTRRPFNRVPGRVSVGAAACRRRKRVFSAVRLSSRVYRPNGSTTPPPPGAIRGHVDVGTQTVFASRTSNENRRGIVVVVCRARSSDGPQTVRFCRGDPLSDTRLAELYIMTRRPRTFYYARYLPRKRVGVRAVPDPVCFLSGGKV